MFDRRPLPGYVEPAVLSHTKKRKNIVHGARAINEQLPSSFQRPTRDYDLWSKKPREHAFELQALLDKKTGGDNFYDASIPLAGSNETVYRVVSRFDGKEVADFMKMPSKTKNLYKVIGGVRYETLSHAKQVYKDILNNIDLRHRHNKALVDLRRIEAFERSLRKGEPSEIPDPFRVFKFKSSQFGGW